MIHTVNPTTGNENEVYVEACRGLGESLVSDAPGSAFSFTIVKDSHIKAAKEAGQKVDQKCIINGYPNKPFELVTNS